LIVLDTHTWVWWVHGDARLHKRHREHIQAHESQGLGVSIISCWEVAKLVEYGRLQLPLPVEEWLNQALAYPGVTLLDRASSSNRPCCRERFTVTLPTSSSWLLHGYTTAPW